MPERPSARAVSGLLLGLLIGLLGGWLGGLLRAPAPRAPSRPGTAGPPDEQRR